jgi:hypothetical protein
MAKVTNRRLIIDVQQRGGSSAHRAMIEAHARAVLAEMCSARLANTLRITIKLRKSVRSGSDKVLGWSADRDYSKGATARSKHYTVAVLSTKSNAAQLQTLTHELQHVVQWAQGRLAMRRTKAHGLATYWRPQGHTGPAQCFPVDTEPAWKDRPWEIEAMAAEKKHHHLAARVLSARIRRRRLPAPWRGEKPCP